LKPGRSDQLSNLIPVLYVALQRGIHSLSAILSVSKKAFNCGVDPSPTPMMPISADSTSVTVVPLAPQ
jgi:hypothetical protein